MGKFNCPVCNELISDTLRECPHCGFNKISSYLLDIERDKASKYIDYTSFHNDIPITTASSLHQQNIPHCPTCGSSNIKKISATKRWVSTGLFGLASSDVGKTMECGNCGYKW